MPDTPTPRPDAPPPTGPTAAGAHPAPSPAPPGAAPGAAPAAVYVVDRVEGDMAVLAPDDATGPHGGGTVDVPVRAFPAGVAAEGAVLRVPVVNGAPDWKAAERDHAEEARRRTERGARAARLFRPDDGGDVAL